MSSHKLAISSYGKDDVRILRVIRSKEDPSSQQVVEYAIQCLLSGSSLETSYTQADNSNVVATDSIKNTLNLLAKTISAEQILSPETFGLVIISHFLSTYSHIENVHLEMKQFKWSRIVLESGPHKHGFVKDENEIRTVKALGKRDSQGDAVVDSIKGGIKDLVVLKSSGSAFYGFVRDQYTTLAEVNDRIFSTSVECEYTTSLPSEPLSTLLSANSEKLPPFNDIHKAATSHILTIFCNHSSPSVQATMYKTGVAILDDTHAKALTQVELSMPNRHYIPIDLKWAGIENVKEDEAEVFLPSAHPSGLIKATVVR